MNLNLSASLNIFKLLAKPSLCLPHATVATFDDLPIPLNKAFLRNGRQADIRAVVLDKDDCFAIPDHSEVHEPYKVDHLASCVASALIPLSVFMVLLCCCTFCLPLSIMFLLSYCDHMLN
jgi:hypothetical protein